MFRSAKSCLVPFVWVVVSCTGSTGDDSACVVARHVDQCCSAPVPASTEEMSRDGCLQLVQRKAAVESCSAVSECNKVACGSQRPAPSRVAQRNGESCAFVDECESDADCVLATNEAFCCGCPEWVPRRLLSSDPCWAASGAQLSSACDACPPLSEATCPACSAASAVVRCVDGGNGYKQCVGQ